MKKEKIVNYFDKCFKGVYDKDLFNYSKCYLCPFAVTKDVNIANASLKSFTKNFYEMCAKIEKDLVAAEEYIHSDLFANSKLVLKIRHKKYLEKLQKQYNNIAKFKAMFFATFSISLVKINESLNCEEFIKRNKKTIRSEK